MINYTLTNFVEFFKIFSTMTFALPKDSKDTEFSNVILKATVDLCRMEKGIRGNFVYKMLVEQGENITSVPKCPLKPRTVSNYNRMFSDKYIPSYLLISDMKFMMEHRLKAKLSKSKPLVHIYTFRVIGEITRT